MTSEAELHAVVSGALPGPSDDLLATLEDIYRDIQMTGSAVVTVGTLSAGMNENVIPVRALLRLNVSTFEEDVRTRMLAAVSAWTGTTATGRT